MAPTLFVVDDDPKIGGFVRLFAESAGFSARVFTNVGDLKQQCSDGYPDILVLDIVMPEQDGFDLIQWLVDQKCQSPLVLISGRDPIYLDTAHKLGLAKGLSIAAAIRKESMREMLPGVLKQLAKDFADAAS